MRGFAVRREGSALQTPAKRFRKYNLELNEGRHEAHRIWILKPLGGFNQIGIHMYSLGKSDVASDEATAAWLFRRVPEGSWVLQEYAMNIMTYDGNKFDLRVYVAVTSFDPLRAYVFEEGLARFSEPLVRVTDAFVGEIHAIRVDVSSVSSRGIARHLATGGRWIFEIAIERATVSRGARRRRR